MHKYKASTDDIHFSSTMEEAFSSLLGTALTSDNGTEVYHLLNDGCLPSRKSPTVFQRAFASEH